MPGYKGIPPCELEKKELTRQLKEGIYVPGLVEGYAVDLASLIKPKAGSRPLQGKLQELVGSALKGVATLGLLAVTAAAGGLPANNQVDYQNKQSDGVRQDLQNNFQTSQKAFQEFLQSIGAKLTGSTVEAAATVETTVSPLNPIGFVLGTDIYSWLMDNAQPSGWGVVWVSKNGSPYGSFGPSHNYIWYPEMNQGDGITVSVACQIAAPDKGKGLIMTSVDDAIGGYFHLRGGELTSNLIQPWDLNARMQITSTGLPDLMYGDPLSSCLRKTDTSGDYVEAMVKGAVNTASNGKYRLRFDNSFNPVGSWVFVPEFRMYLPALFMGVSQ